MASVFEQVLILFIFALIGFVLCRLKRVDGSKVGLLSTLEFFVFMPCVSFQTFSQRFTVNYLQEKYSLVLISLGILLALELFARLVAPQLSKDSYQKLVFRYSLIIPNFGFFGYSLMQGLFGAEGLMDMMMFSLPMSVYTSTIGYAVLTNQPGKFSVKKVFTPSIIAIILGGIVGITGLQIPSVLEQIVQKSAACMSPVSMLLAGIVIAEYKLKELLADKRAYFVCAMRLLVVPTLLFFLLKVTRLEIAMLAAIITYCGPCGLNPIVYGKLSGQDCRIGAGLALISTVLAMATIPLCVYFFLN